MQEIRTLVTNLAMCRSYSFARLSSLGITTVTTVTTVAGVTRAPGQATLGLSKPFLAVSEVARVVYLLSVRKVSEMLKPNVDAHRLTLVGRWVKLILNRKARVPMLPVLTVSPDSDSLDLPTNRTIHLELEYPNLGESEPVVVQGPTRLGVGETVIPTPSLETRITTPLEERFERSVYPVKDILQSLAVHVRKVRSDLFTLHESGGLLSKADTIASHAISIPPVLEGCVVQLTAQVEVVSQQAGLAAGGAKAVLEGAPGNHCTHCAHCTGGSNPAHIHYSTYVLPTRWIVHNVRTNWCESVNIPTHKRDIPDSSLTTAHKWAWL